MYAITGGRFHNDEATDKTRKYATYISEEKLERPGMVNGELYHIVYQQRNGPDIGVLENDYIKSGLGTTRHYGLIEQVDPTEVSVLILNTDGKQKGRDLVGENIGNVFPIIEVGTHDTYKYIIDIDGERVALSMENVAFVNSDSIVDEKTTMKFIKYRGVTLFIKEIRDGVTKALYGIDINTGNGMYVYNNNFEVIDDAVRVGLNSSTLEFVDEERMVRLREDVLVGYTTKELRFNLSVPVKRDTRRGELYTAFMFYATTKDHFKEISKTLSKQFRYDKRDEVFYFNG